MARLQNDIETATDAAGRGGPRGAQAAWDRNEPIAQITWSLCSIENTLA